MAAAAHAANPKVKAPPKRGFAIHGPDQARGWA
jgi:hypothetical protein